MSADHERQDELERQLTRTLRAQPLRRAPESLERRVLAQLEASAAVTPWRRGFAHWPMAARVAFLAASIGFIKVALSIAVWISTPLDARAFSLDLPSQIAWVQTLFAAIGSVARTVPSLWVHAAIALFAIMYLALFGVGASAYRTLRAA